jgi:competence protein ComFC
MQMPALTILKRHFLDFCYPGACAMCDAACEGDVPLCESCRIDLAKQENAAACEHCAMPVKEHGDPCPYCRGKGVPHFERIVRLGIYEDPLKHLIHLMKYRHAWNLAEFLTDRLLDQERVKSLMQQTDVIVPVPLFFTRQIARGFNQAELIARHLGRRCGHRIVNAITRVRPTETQTNLSATQREENLRGALALIDPKRIKGKHVVVVDDVKTTGATLQSAARALEEAKPASLSAITIAIADPKGRGFEQI